MSKKCTPLWREAHFEVKMHKAHQSRTAFRSWDVEKVHAVVARSTFPSQNAQSTPTSDHFWKLRCRESARRFGAKHISKSKVERTEGSGALLDVRMSFCVAGTRDSAPRQMWAKREGQGFCSNFNYTLRYNTLQLQLQVRLQLQLPLHYTTLHYTNYTTLHSTSLHYTQFY